MTHVRLSIYPDGGVARFRVHGEGRPDRRLLTGTIDLAAIENGGRVLDCSNRFYSSPSNILLPGRAATMGDGWENARRRDEGNDHVTVRLAGRGRVRRMEIDTSYFVGNAPGWARVTGDSGVELVARVGLQPDTRHHFVVENIDAGRHRSPRRVPGWGGRPPSHLGGARVSTAAGVVPPWARPDNRPTLRRLLERAGGYVRQVSSPTEQLAPALDIDARLTEIERSVNLLLNVTPVNAAEAWADFERSDFGTAPTLRLRPLEFEPDLVRRDLYDLEVENVTDPALHTLFRAKRDEIARQITALEDRDTSRFVYGSLQLYGGVSPPLASAAEELLETIPAQAPSSQSVTAGAFAEAAREEFDRYRALYPDFPIARRGARRRLRADGVVRPAAHPRVRRHQGGPRRALAAPRGRHPCRHLPERRQAAADAADDRAARLRRDPGGSCRARRVPDRRTGPAASARARGDGSSPSA